MGGQDNPGGSHFQLFSITCTDNDIHPEYSHPNLAVFLV